MNIPPASFRVTSYGEVDTEALERLRDDYDTTTQLLRLVDGLDLLLKQKNNIAASGMASCGDMPWRKRCSMARHYRCL